MYDFMYNTLVNIHNIDVYNIPDLNDPDSDFVYLPFDILPLPVFHETIISITTTQSKSELKVMYDLYLYDLKKDPCKIVKSNIHVPMPNRPKVKNDYIQDTFTYRNIDYKYEKYFVDYRKQLKEYNVFYEDNLEYRLNISIPFYQTQFCGREHIDLSDSSTKIRLNFNYPVKYIAMNIPIDTDIDIRFNDLWLVKLKGLKESYHIDGFTIYELPWINFSRIDNVQLIFNDTTKLKTDTLIVFVVNINILSNRMGMAGTEFGG
jgi:hypothetical protein